MIAVRDHLDRLGEVQPVVVSFNDDVERLAAYREHLAVDFPFVSDPERELYRELGAGRGRIRDVWSLGTMRMYARLLVRGMRLRVPIEDTRQLGADAVVDRAGRVVRVWLPDGPDHRPTIDDLATFISGQTPDERS